MLSNFEKGFEMLVASDDMKNGGSKTRKMNECICLMYSEDPILTEKLIPNMWVRERALNSPFAEKYL